MLKKLYTTAVINILQFFNYNKIENKKGTNQAALNIIDFILALAYLVYSLRKLEDVSSTVLGVNLLILSRLIIGNLKGSVKIRKQYEDLYLRKPGLCFKSAFDIKLIIDFCVIAFALLPFCFQAVVFEESVIRSFAGIVTVLGFIENLLNIFPALFQASMAIEEVKTDN